MVAPLLAILLQQIISISATVRHTQTIVTKINVELTINPALIKEFTYQAIKLLLKRHGADLVQTE